MASGDSYAPNTIGGSATKTIAVANMPSHNHVVNASGTHNHTASASTVGNHTHSVSGTTGGAGSHSHTRGNMNITGSVTASKTDAGIDDNFNSTGAFTAINGMHIVAQAGSDSFYGWEGFSFDASKSWTGATSSNGSHAHTIGNTGSGLPLNIMPPYTTVYAWRRTA